MTETPKKTGSAYPRENPKHWIGVTADDIPPGWMDDMVKRLFEVTNRDLIRLETAQLKEPVERGPDNRPKPDDLEKLIPQVEKRQRLVTKLQHTIERLTDMELKRQPDRKGERKRAKAEQDGEAKREIKRRIKRIRSGPGNAAAGSEQ